MPGTDPVALIARMPGGILRYEGVSYPIGQHGFARDQRFEASDPSSRSVLFTLVDSPQTREQFSFCFRLEVCYSAPGEFVFIEPWCGMTAAGDFSGEYSDKPHQFVLEPNASRAFSYSVTIEQPHP